MHAPSILILDEPTKGFDPVNRRLLMDLVDEQRAQGSTVIMVTHQMDEVERSCVTASCWPRTAGPRPTARSPGGGGCLGGRRMRLVQRRAAGLGELPGGGQRTQLRRAGAARGHRHWRTVSQANCWTPASSCVTSPPRGRSLEEIFLKVYGDEAVAA